MSAQQFERIAQEAQRLAVEAEQVCAHLRRLGDEAMGVIGGSATGADKAMLGLAQQAAAKSRIAATAFAEAARTAHNAAAAERDRERKHPERSH